MTLDGEVYLIRYRFDRRTSLTLVACVMGVILLLLWRIDSSTWHQVERARTSRVLMIAIIVVSGLQLAYRAARRTVIARVDYEGITLQALRLERSRRSAHFAWEDVAEVVLFTYIKRTWSRRRDPCIGVRPRSDAGETATTLDPGNPGDSAAEQAVPIDVVVRSRHLGFASLDERQLCEAVARFASDVRVIRVDDSGRRRPVCWGERHERQDFSSSSEGTQ